MEDSEYLLDDKESECLLNDDDEALIQWSKRNCTESAIAAKNERGWEFLLNSRRSRKATILTVKLRISMN